MELGDLSVDKNGNLICNKINERFGINWRISGFTTIDLSARAKCGKVFVKYKTIFTYEVF